MEKSNNFKILFLLLVCIQCVISCENTDLNAESIETTTDIEESYISSSESSTATFGNESDNVEILLHMSFDSKVTKGNALAQFEKATVEYLAKNKQMNNGARSKFRYTVTTETADGKYLGTDGIVHARVWFLTDIGLLKYIKRLDNANKNDFKKGSIDCFLLEVTPSTPVCWVSISPNNNAIGLKGTDSWGIMSFKVDMTPQMQPSNLAQGSTGISSYPEIVLDNISSNLWDKYFVTDIIGNTGKINFNCY